MTNQEGIASIMACSEGEDILPQWEENDLDFE